MSGRLADAFAAFDDGAEPAADTGRTSAQQAEPICVQVSQDGVRISLTDSALQLGPQQLGEQLSAAVTAALAQPSAAPAEPAEQPSPASPATPASPISPERDTPQQFDSLAAMNAYFTKLIEDRLT